jgi:hypothetical protein
VGGEEEEGGVMILGKWLVRHLGGIVAGMSFFVMGLICVVRPAYMIRTAYSRYPETEPDVKNPTSRLIVRLIGAGFLFFGVLILSHL